MKKEIMYRVFRIVFMIMFLLFISFLRNDVQESYKGADSIIDSMPSFVVTSLENKVNNDSGLVEEHNVKIKNVSNAKKSISFVLKDTNEGFPYNHLKYTIIKDDTIIKEGIVRENVPLYKGKLARNESSIYKIVFSMSKEDIYTLGGVSVSAKLQFI